MKPSSSKSPKSGRADRDALRQRVRHPYITGQSLAPDDAEIDASESAGDAATKQAARSDHEPGAGPGDSRKTRPS